MEALWVVTYKNADDDFLPPPNKLCSGHTAPLQFLWLNQLSKMQLLSILNQQQDPLLQMKLPCSFTLVFSSRRRGMVQPDEAAAVWLM